MTSTAKRELSDEFPKSNERSTSLLFLKWIFANRLLYFKTDTQTRLHNNYNISAKYMMYIYIYIFDNNSTPSTGTEELSASCSTVHCTIRVLTNIYIARVHSAHVVGPICRLNSTKSGLSVFDSRVRFRQQSHSAFLIFTRVYFSVFARCRVRVRSSN